MPPHCDSLDGPVVVAARHALDVDDVDVVLPFVPVDGEDEVRAAFDLTRKARIQGPEARQVADLYFFDTVVRVHRRGEGAPHTGLKPAGLDVGPVIPLAEAAVETGDAEPLIAFLQRAVREEVQQRLADVQTLAAATGTGVPAARAYTSAMLGLVVWSHRLWRATTQRHGH